MPDLTSISRLEISLEEPKRSGLVTPMFKFARPNILNYVIGSNPEIFGADRINLKSP